MQASRHLFLTPAATVILAISSGAGEASRMMDQDGFSSQAAARLAGITYRQLDHWARSGFISPSLSMAKPGIGRRRQYSFLDLLMLRTAAELRQAGVPLQTLRRVVTEMRRLSDDSALLDVRLVLDGNDILLADGDTALSILRRPGQGVLRLFVDVGDVVRQLRQATASLPEQARPIAG